MTGTRTRSRGINLLSIKSGPLRWELKWQLVQEESHWAILSRIRDQAEPGSESLSWLGQRALGRMFPE